MIERSAGLQRFLDLTREAIAARARPSEPAAIAGEKIFAALARSATLVDPAEPSRLPACRHLTAALDTARKAAPSAACLAQAFAAIEPGLAWRRRAGADAAGAVFAEGHANAVIVGAGGLEQRDEAMIGVSLMAPGVQYPDHRHSPEEVYVVLSAGQWRQEDRPWHEPGPGGIVYNPAHIVHAMRSTAAPLLAIWCLWPGGEGLSPPIVAAR